MNTEMQDLNAQRQQPFLNSNVTARPSPPSGVIFSPQQPFQQSYQSTPLGYYNARPIGRDRGWFSAELEFEHFRQFSFTPSCRCHVTILIFSVLCAFIITRVSNIADAIEDVQNASESQWKKIDQSLSTSADSLSAHLPSVSVEDIFQWRTAYDTGYCPLTNLCNGKFVLIPMRASSAPGTIILTSASTVPTETCYWGTIHDDGGTPDTDSFLGSACGSALSAHLEALSFKRVAAQIYTQTAGSSSESCWLEDYCWSLQFGLVSWVESGDSWLVDSNPKVGAAFTSNDRRRCILNSYPDLEFMSRAFFKIVSSPSGMGGTQLPTAGCAYDFSLFPNFLVADTNKKDPITQNPISVDSILTHSRIWMVSWGNPFCSPLRVCASIDKLFWASSFLFYEVSDDGEYWYCQVGQFNDRIVDTRLLEVLGCVETRPSSKSASFLIPAVCSTPAVATSTFSFFNTQASGSPATEIFAQTQDGINCHIGFVAATWTPALLPGIGMMPKLGHSLAFLKVTDPHPALSVCDATQICQSIRRNSFGLVADSLSVYKLVACPDSDSNSCCDWKLPDNSPIPLVLTEDLFPDTCNSTAFADGDFMAVGPVTLPLTWCSKTIRCGMSDLSTLIVDTASGFLSDPQNQCVLATIPGVIFDIGLLRYGCPEID